MHILSEKLQMEILDTEASAREFLTELQAQSLVWHFEDDPHDCLSETGLTEEEIDILDAQRDRLYELTIFDAVDCPIGLALQIGGHMTTTDDSGIEIPWPWTNAQTK